MNGNSNAMKLSAHAAGRHLLPRWRMVFIALLLVLMVGSVSQTTPAQAAADAEDWELYMAITGDPSDPICIGDKVDLIVKILGDKVGDSETAPLTPKIHLLGISVNAGVLGDQIGTLSPKNAVISASNDPPDSARFTFVAKEAGQVTLNFDAKVNTSWFGPFSSPRNGIVSNDVAVTVIPCKFKVKTVLSFNPGIYNITVISDEAVMTRDQAGTFTGSSSMHWVYSNFSIPCSVSAADSSVDLTGKLDDNGGQFIGSENFGPATPVGCGGSGGGSVSPLQFKVASSGGVSTSTASAPPLSGSATIIIVPEKDQASAFNDGNPQARIGVASSWWAMLWNAFPGLNSASLALR